MFIGIVKNNLRLENAPVVLSGALRDDSTGAHSFIFLRRRGGGGVFFKRFATITI